MVSPAGKSGTSNAAAAAAAATKALNITASKKAETPPKPQPATSAHGWVKPQATGNTEVAVWPNPPVGSMAALLNLARSFNLENAKTVGAKGLPLAMARVPEGVQALVTNLMEAKTSGEFPDRFAHLDQGLQKAMLAISENTTDSAMAALQRNDLRTVASYALLATSAKSPTFAGHAAPWYGAYSKGLETAPQIKGQDFFNFF